MTPKIRQHGQNGFTQNEQIKSENSFK